MKKQGIVAIFLFMGLMAPEIAMAQKGPQPVIVTEVKRDHFEDRVEALGTLRANETVTLTSTVTEAVTAVNFEDGQRVRKGDILIEMMSEQEAAELDAQQAMVEEARRQLERAIPLVKSGASSKSILDQRRAEFDGAKAGFEEVKSRISDRIITVPFDGVLGLRNISVGTVLQPGMKITTLDDDTVMKLDFSVPSVFLSALKPGLEIEASSNSFEGKKFKGTISSIDSQIDSNTRSVQVRALIPNDDGTLKPGLLMSLEILKNPRESIVILEEAIVPAGSKNHVFVVKSVDGKNVTQKREVELGARRPGEVEIISGLEPGEILVTHGTLNISDGSEVTVRARQTGKESLPDILKQQPEAQPETKTEAK
jgi:membrane fusion protein, multidrug efflux system